MASQNMGEPYLAPSTAVITEAVLTLLAHLHGSEVRHTLETYRLYTHTGDVPSLYKHWRRTVFSLVHTHSML